jgi:hypothetical protein
MSASLRPFRGHLRFTCEGRTVTVSRKDEAWAVNAGRSTRLEHVVSEVIGALELAHRPQMVVCFEAEGGLVGRIRDGGGPRESYVVDYDAPHECWGAGEATMESALTALLERLESEDPPDSDWPSSPRQ